ALVASFVGGERLACYDIARREQYVEQVSVPAIRRRLASLGDNLVHGREPRLLKPVTLASRNRESRLLMCQHVQDVWVPWSFDVASDHGAKPRSLLAVGHREEGTQCSL